MDNGSPRGSVHAPWDVFEEPLRPDCGNTGIRGADNELFGILRRNPDHAPPKKKNSQVAISGGEPPRRRTRSLYKTFTITLSVLLAFSFVTLAVVGPTTQKAEAIAPLVVVGIALASAAIGYAINEWLNDNKDDALLTGDPSQYALTIATGLKNTLTMTENQIKDFKNHQDLLSYYYIRKAEWAARNLWIEQNNTDKVFQFDPLYVLKASEIGRDMMEYTDYSMKQFEIIANSLDGIGINLTGEYASVKSGIWGSWPYAENGGTWGIYSTPANPALNISLMVRLYGDSLVYWDGANDLLVPTDQSSDYVVHIKDGTTTLFSKNIVRTQYSQSYVHIPASEINLTAGIYTFSGGIMGNFCPLQGSYIDPIIMIRNIIALNAYNDDKLTVKNNGGTSSETIYSEYTTIGAFANVNDRFVADYGYRIEPYVNAMMALINKIMSVKTNVMQFAQSYYNAIVVSGDPGGAWDLPLMLMPDPSQMEGMDWQQLYSLYLAYIQQASEWYQDHHGALDASKVNISAQSLNLKIRGSIVNETGVTKYDNTTVWTPYITNAEMTLELGPNIVEFAMYGIKWGNANSMANFTQSTGSTLIGIDPGYTLYIQEMIYQNESVETLTLSPTTVQVAITNIIGPPGPPNIKQITDLDWIISRWYYIAIIGGVICLLGTIATRNMSIMAVGLVLLAAGGIGWYLAGDTSLLNWLSMEPPNLVAWLQRLR